MKNPNVVSDGLLSFSSWLEGKNVAAVTGWRWRKRGWVKTIVIGNRHYISVEAIAEFRKRAETGEFASLSKEPTFLTKTGTASE